ncbi:MAG: tryptophan ABC transporter substrate-binding protein [Patescibacteria group bacterium]|nr:MAG: tryptophan ABC transporter substrate-binding protein [Patescibacteria group bacterium]
MKKIHLFSFIVAVVVIGGLFYVLLGQRQGDDGALRQYTVGIVNPGGDTFTKFFNGFTEGMRNIERDMNLSIKIVRKNYEGNKETRIKMVTEVVGLNPDIFVTISGQPTLQALSETLESQIPVLTALGDPVEHGYIDSLQSSGTNLTGVAQQNIELTPKRFELLKEMIPDVRRVAVFYDTTCGPTRKARPIANAFAPKLGLELVEFPLTVPTREELEQALQLVNKDDFDALMFYPHGTLFSKSDIFLAKAKKEGLPIIMPDEGSISFGAIASYGPNYYEMGKRLARIAGKVLSGILPRDIPFEQPNRIDFVISLQNAQKLGVELPETILGRASKIVD